MGITNYISLVILLVMIGCGTASLSDPAQMAESAKLDERYKQEPLMYLDGKRPRILKETLQSYYNDVQKIPPANGSKLKPFYDKSCAQLKTELEKTADKDGYIYK